MVVTAVAKPTDLSMPVSPFLLAMYQKRVQGALFGMMSPTKDIPRLLDMYRAGQLKLDELVTRTTRWTRSIRATTTCTLGEICAVLLSTNTDPSDHSEARHAAGTTDSRFVQAPESTTSWRSNGCRAPQSFYRLQCDCLSERAEGSR